MARGRRSRESSRRRLRDRRALLSCSADWASRPASDDGPSRRGPGRRLGRRAAIRPIRSVRPWPSGDAGSRRRSATRTSSISARPGARRGVPSYTPCGGGPCVSAADEIDPPARALSEGLSHRPEDRARARQRPASPWRVRGARPCYERYLTEKSATAGAEGESGSSAAFFERARRGLFDPARSIAIFERTEASRRSRRPPVASPARVHRSTRSSRRRLGARRCSY